MEEEFQLITTLFKWRMGQCWKLQAPLTVLTSCTRLVCQPTTVQDTVIPFHLYYSMVKVRMYSVELNILTFFNVFTDFMEKTMPSITPSYESDDGIQHWLKAFWIILAILLLSHSW